MQLFQLRNYQVIFEPQTMMIKEFADIRDSNKGDDEMTLKEMAFIWYFADVKSDFQSILDDEERIKEIKFRISLPDDWKPSKEVLNGIDFYKEYSKTPSSGLYKASMITAQYIEKQLKNPQALMDKLNSRGEPIYKLDSLMKILKDVPTTMEKLHSAQEQVVKEIESKAQLKGNKEKATFEDGI